MGNVVTGLAPVSRLAQACFATGLITCGLTVLAYPVVADYVAWLPLGLVQSLAVSGLVLTWVLGLRALKATSPKRGRLRGGSFANWGLGLATVVAGGGILFLSACTSVRSAGARALTLNKLQQIGMALHNY